MAQAKKVMNSNAEKAMRKLNDNNPTTLTDDMEIVERDGGVFLRIKRIRYVTRPNGNVEEHETILERRCDADKDSDAKAAGIDIWWEELLRQQKARDSASKRKATKGDA